MTRAFKLDLVPGLADDAIGLLLVCQPSERKLAIVYCICMGPKSY